MATRSVYDTELKKIDHSVYIMGTEVENAIDKTIFAFRNKSDALAADIMKNDDRIDKMETEIEEDCINIVVKESPIASDWRKIASYMRMTSDMERIADNCSDIAIYIRKISDYKEEIEEPKGLDEMFGIMRGMVRDTFESFQQGDVVLASSVIDEDDVVDQYFEKMNKEIGELMKQHSEHIQQYIDFILINKYIERMADHSANIASWVKFVVRGELDLKFTDRYAKESQKK